MSKILWLLAALSILALSRPANAELFVVQSCGTLPKNYSAGSTRLDTVDINGVKCSNATGGSGGGGGNVNVTEVASTAIGNFGSNPGAVPAIPTNSSVISSVLPTNAAEETGGNLATAAANTGTTATNTGTTATNTGTTATNTGTTNTNLGAPGATACTTDTASCSLNQFLQRIAQRITTLITNLGTQAYDGSGNLKVNVAAGGAGGGNVNLTQVASATLGAITTYGSSPGAVNVPSVNAYVTNTNPNGAATVASSTAVNLSNMPVAAAAVSTNQITVGATATLIVPARTGLAGSGRVSTTIVNPGATNIYIGGSGVTTSTGMLLPGISGANMTLTTTAAIYGIVASSTATVSEFELY